MLRFIDFRDCYSIEGYNWEINRGGEKEKRRKKRCSKEGYVRDVVEENSEEYLLWTG